MPRGKLQHETGPTTIDVELDRMVNEDQFPLFPLLVRLCFSGLEVYGAHKIFGHCRLFWLPQVGAIGPFLFVKPIEPRHIHVVPCIVGNLDTESAQGAVVVEVQ